jgi:hypothetical protein
MRRKPSSISAARIDPDDRRILSGRVAPKNDELQYRPHPTDGVQVVDDLHEIVAVTQRELDVIETYLGTLLDDMMKCVE